MFWDRRREAKRSEAKGGGANCFSPKAQTRIPPASVAFRAHGLNDACPMASWRRGGPPSRNGRATGETPKEDSRLRS